MIHIVFSKHSLYITNYYHFIIDYLRPLYNYIGVNNINNSDIIIYCNINSHFKNIMKELRFIVKPLDEVPDNPVEICKLEYTEIKYIINKFNTFIKPLRNKEKIILIKRNNMRILLNHSELLQSLSIFNDKYYIKEVDFDNKTLAQQIKLMSNCKILIGPHGAGFTNMLFMNENTHVFEFFPESFYLRFYAKIADKKNINYYYLHGKDIIPPPICLEDYLWNHITHEIWKKENMSWVRLVRDVNFSINIEDVINYIKTIA
jgi:capsular polysaccharide biosynthesis protein